MMMIIGTCGHQASIFLRGEVWICVFAGCVKRLCGGVGLPTHLSERFLSDQYHIDTPKQALEYRIDTGNGAKSSIGVSMRYAKTRLGYLCGTGEKNTCPISSESLREVMKIGHCTFGFSGHCAFDTRN